MSESEKRSKRKKMELHCPMPKLDFDVITLGHGSGGILTHRLLKAGVFDLLSNEWLDEHHDGAIFSLQGKMAFTTDSFVVSPIFFPGGNIGDLAINGTVNDLAMCGAIPKYLSLAFIIEEGLLMTEFWEILVSIKMACEHAGVRVVTGDTKVVESGKGDKIFINTSGIGIIHSEADIGTHRIDAGDKVIVSDCIATHGLAIMSVREGIRFDTTITSDTRHLSHIAANMFDKFGGSIHLLRDPTRGGVATVMSEIARESNFGINLIQKDIPVDKQVAAGCELLGLDPLYVANEGIFVAIVQSDISEELISYLRSSETCSHASVIGEVVEDHPGQVVLTSGIGGRRVVNMLVGQQLPRIC